MGTIDSREFIESIIEGNGWPVEVSEEAKGDPDNPPAIKIVEYTNKVGRKAWGVVFRGERGDPNRYEVETEFVRNPEVIWVKECD